MNTLNPKNIVQKLIDTATTAPEKIAIIDHEKSISGSIRYVHKNYGQLINDVLATAENFKEQGIRKGDRIIVFVPMSYSLYVTVISLLYIGSTAVFIDAWANPERIRKACLVVNPRGFIGSWKAQVLRLHSDIRNIPVKMLDTKVVSTSCQNREIQADNIQPEPISAADTAIITLTTGTTGLPKGANRTHELLWEQFKILGKHLQLSDTDIDLTALPIFVLNNLGLGVTSVLPLFNPARPVAFNPDRIVDQITNLNITTTIGSPAFYEKLADHLLTNNIKLSINKVYTGGAPVFPPLAEKLLRAFPGSDLEILYGCTEAEPISATKAENLLDLPPFSGLPLGRKIDEIEVEIVKPLKTCENTKHPDLNSTKVLGAENSGEIIISGPHVLKEYIGNPESYSDTKIHRKDKTWHRTGDLGHIDSNGTIYFFGKVKNSLTISGSCIYPLPYEKELINLSGIAFASVIQINEAVYAVIEPDKATLTPKAEIIQKAKSVIKDLVPVKIVTLKKIPRDPRHHSKVNYSKLKKILHKKTYKI